MSITPEKVAGFLAGADNDFHEGLDAWPSLRVNGNVVEIKMTPADYAGEEDEDNASHFRAVVVEGETVPLILNRERYADEVASLVERLVRALAHAPREEYPIHVAQLRGSLLALADESIAASAAQGEAETAGDAL